MLNNIYLAIHRLDKLTSGVLIFSKNPKHMISFQKKDENNYKIYFARVEGNFKYINFDIK